MSPAQMLNILSENGRDNGSIFNHELGGWFSWEIVGDTLFASFEDNEGNETTNRWRLVPGN